MPLDHEPPGVAVRKHLSKLQRSASRIHRADHAVLRSHRPLPGAAGDLPTIPPPPPPSTSSGAGA